MTDRVASAEIVCHDCGTLLALRWRAGGLHVIPPGADWYKGRVVITCPECENEIKVRVNSDEREAA